MMRLFWRLIARVKHRVNMNCVKYGPRGHEVQIAIDDAYRRGFTQARIDGLKKSIDDSFLEGLRVGFGSGVEHALNDLRDEQPVGDREPEASS